MKLNLIIPSVLNFPNIAWFPKLFLEVSHQGQGYVDAAEPNLRKTFASFMSTASVKATLSRQINSKICFKFS